MYKISLFMVLGLLTFSLSQLPAYAFQASSTKFNYLPPIIENSTRSLTVSMHPKILYGHYTILATNNSTKSIVFITIKAFYRKKSLTLVQGGDFISPVLPPGKTIRITPPLPQVDVELPLEQFSDPSEEPKVVISEIGFDDLTYEGDRIETIRTAGRWLGYKIQTRKIVELFQKALIDADQDKAKVLGNLRQQIGKLIDRAVESDTKNIEQYYSPLTTFLTDELKLYTSMGLTSGKQDTLSVISHYEIVESAKGVSFNTWLAGKIEFYEKRIKDLSVIP